MAERVGFEPTKSYPLHTFQACSFDRSDTSPVRFSGLLCDCGASCRFRWWQPNPAHLGTQIRCYRCSLPGLAGFTTYRCEGTGKGHHRGAYASEIELCWVASFHLPAV